MKFAGYRNKKLICPIPGMYSEDYKNPLDTEEPVIPYLTDENGMVAFTKLHFSEYGRAGIY